MIRKATHVTNAENASAYTAYLDDHDTEMKVGLEEHVIVKINCDTDQETVESVIK